MKAQAEIDLIRTLISSLRFSVETAFGIRTRQFPPEVRNVLMQLENARLFMSPVYRQRGGEIELGSFMVAAQEVREIVQNILTNRSYDFIHKVTFRVIRNPSRENVLETFLPDLRQNRVLVSEALQLLERIIDDTVTAALPDGSSAQSLAALRKVIPAQRLAPAQFDISGGKLIVVKSTNTTYEEDRRNIQDARAQLLFNGKKILEQLKLSNCDKRLVETVESLQALIETEQSIIQVGLTNLQSAQMSDVFATELPDALLAMMRAHSRGVDMYAGQFPEWNKFVENAALSALTAEDHQSISSSVDKVLTALKDHPDVADPEVPKIFAQLKQLLANPKGSAKRAAYAAVRTVENLVSKVFGVCVEFISKTTTKAIDALSSTAAKVLVVAALAGAADLITISVPDLGWMRTAVEVVKREVQRAAK